MSPADIIQMDREAAEAFGRGIIQSIADDGIAIGQKNRDWAPEHLRFGQRHTTPTGTAAVGRYAHGPTGIFTLPGVDPTLYSTIVGIESISAMLPSAGVLDTNPLFTSITGVQDETGSEPDAPCDDAPIAGLIKACTLTAVFGRYTRMTPEIDIRRMGQRVNRGDPTDLRVANGPRNAGIAGIFSPDGTQPSLTAAINGEVNKIMYEFGINVNRLLAPQVFSGNPANNTAGGGSKEFPGLDILIGTGKVDAESNTACPSLDSVIRDFNFTNIGDGLGGNSIVEEITYIWRILRKNARTMGLDPAEIVIAMREELFYEVTAAWPCSYLTYRCEFRTDNGTIVQNVDAAEQVAFRDRMRQGRFLTIDGMDVSVVLDDGITEENAATQGDLVAGEFASNIYFIPLTVLGGTPVTFWQFFDYANGDASQAMSQISPAGSFRVTNGGAWLWHMKPPLNWCIQAIATTEPRLIMRTPFLAANLQNVAYTPIIHTRQPFPDDPYFVNGGATERPAPSFFNEWQV
jgi:hypothetical protein